uniref:Enhancer of rudimentary homolog n=1 Tax=Anopheles minimus TaxID=112268 RepID=A0A182W4J9_9DIPT
MSHTILLVQLDQDPLSRTYSDYETINACLNGVCKIFENHLQERHPGKLTITYDASQLFQFIDQIADMSCLVYHHDTQVYTPHNKAWIKEKVYNMLKADAMKGK